MRRILSAAALAASLALPAAAQSTGGQTILVLDASGSMWGQIDGTAKIGIAQSVIGDLLESLPEDQALGLSAYGHRTRGDCTDIETLVEPGTGTRDAIAAAVIGGTSLAGGVGTVAGAMLGALHGLEAFPVEWLGALEDADALRSEAEALVDALGG